MKTTTAKLCAATSLAVYGLAALDCSADILPIYDKRFKTEPPPYVNIHRHAPLDKMDYRKPNIIYIMADDLGYGDIGSYGQTNIITPRLDEMAEKGTRFSQFYAGCHICAPSRSCMISGQHLGRTDIRTLHYDVNSRQLPNSPSIGRELKKVGYTTAFFGKSGLGEAWSSGLPARLGFDLFYGFSNHNEAHDYYPKQIWQNDQLVPVPGNNFSNTNYSTDFLTQEAINFAAQNTNKPFFITLNYNAPHVNSSMYSNGNPYLPVPDDESSLSLYQSKGWPDTMVKRAAIITRMDRQIGNLIDAVKTLGIASNTLIMFTSDNGPKRYYYPDNDDVEIYHNSNGDLKGWKAEFYEGGIRVPLIVYWPGKIPTGQVSDVQGAFQDILPTFLDLANAEELVAESVQGISLKPAFFGQTQTNTHDYLFWRHWNKSHLNPEAAIRSNDWKLLRVGAVNNYELYNLSNDVSEITDVAASNPLIVSNLIQLMEQAYEPSPYMLKGPVGHWPLDEGSGTNTADTTGTSPSFLIGMNDLAWVTDIPGTNNGAYFTNSFALEFDGVNDNLQTHYPGIGGNNPRTICCWLKTTNVENQIIILWGFENTESFSYLLRVNNSAARGTVGAIRTSAYGGEVVGSTLVNNGQWHHVASVFDGGNITNTRHYINGKLDGISGSRPIKVDTELTLGRADGSTLVTIGSAKNTKYFKGKLDDIGLFNYALSEEQIQFVMSNGIAALDVDYDSLPDTWEIKHNLDPNLPDRHPVNDNFTNAIEISGAENTYNYIIGTNALASAEAGELAHAGRGPFNSVWWKATPTENILLDINTYGSSFDTVLAAYRGSSVDSLTLIASNDNETNSFTGNSVLTNVYMQAGKTYYIVVDGADKTEAGPVHLLWYSAGVSIPEPFYSCPANAGISFVIYLIFRFSRRIRVK
jgi:arylsulfatase A-like enzyme